MDVLQDVLLSMNLRIQDARGQCHDGATAITSVTTSVATQIKAINDKCLFTLYTF